MPMMNINGDYNRNPNINALKRRGLLVMVLHYYGTSSPDLKNHDRTFFHTGVGRVSSFGVG